MIPGRPSDTAQVVCLIRALDAAWRGERSLIRDVYARRFLTPPYAAAYAVNANPAGRVALAPLRWLHQWIVFRHGFIDRILREHGPAMPVVLLGAGYDSRAWRLADSLTQGIHEIDFASTQQRKRAMAERAGLDASGAIYVEADFAKESLARIFARTGLKGQPAVIVWEGVSMYLDEAVVRGTLREAGAFFGPGSILVADFWTSRADRLRRKLPASPVGGLIRGVIPEPFLFGTSPREVAALAGQEGVPETRLHTDTEIAAALKMRSGLIRSPYFVGVFAY